MNNRWANGPSRRDFIKLASLTGLAGGGLLTVRPARATPEAMREAIRQVVGKAKINAGRVQLEIPPLVENGNTVPCEVTVDSPMTESDHVTAIHVFCEKNPQPNVFGAKLGPRAGRAAIATRIRLSDTQTVTAIAQLSDGSFWSDSVDVIITLGACLEDLV
jgi:sulfur-oxidizing protein SoxY